MIKDIETLTANEFLKRQVAKGLIPTCPIRPKDGPNFSPNEITISKAYD